MGHVLGYARVSTGDQDAAGQILRLEQAGAVKVFTDVRSGKTIDLLSLEEKIDTSSAAGELVFHVFGAIAHFERRLISERTKDGIAAARAKGRRPGRQPLDTKKVEAAIKLVEANLSPTEAASQVGLGRSTIYREMRRLGITRSSHEP